jgi:bacillithiol biosynthesis cysteine-adding enzyme BshC
VISEALGGGALARAGLAGKVPRDWYEALPMSPPSWIARMKAVQATVSSDWLESLNPAMEAADAARERLTRVARAGGVVVTTGQQPGLFGGPIYTWSKALTARALADELEAASGIPVAPLFWAATDDSDFAEASSTTVCLPGGFEQLQLGGSGSTGQSMSAMPLPDVSLPLAGLRRACGSGADGSALAAAERAYRSGNTVGSAYVELLRELLQPLGVAVLDASHQAVRSAAHQICVRALERHDAVRGALVERTAAIRAAGFESQVADVDGLTLVFDNRDGRRLRISRASAEVTAEAAVPGSLSPNVLLRPIVERALLPTVAYAAGPGEYAYFAQVSAAAQALGAALPLAVPRWSATLVEPHIDRLLGKYALTIADVADGDALAVRLSQRAVPSELVDGIRAMREQLQREAERLRAAVRLGGEIVPERSVDAIERAISWRVDRFERRVRAGVRRRDTALSADLGTLGGALYPAGVRQERTLNIIPLLARYGRSLLEQMLEQARLHACALVRPGA